VILGLVLLSAAAQTLPRLLSLVRQSGELAALTYDERRARLIAEYYPSLQTIRTTTNNGPLGLIAFTPLDWDRAFFAAYYLYPQPTRPFLRYEHYRDSPIKDRYPTLVALNLERDPRLRVATYDAIVEESAPPPVIANTGEALFSGDNFIVPVALSVFGPIPHDYRTEAVLESDGQATVTMTYYPSGATRSHRLMPRSPMRIADVSMDVFGVKGTGWVRVTSTSPIRASFWFVNRGTRHATPIPLMTAAQLLPRQLDASERLWVVNPGERPVEVFVNNERINLGPHGLHIQSASQSSSISGTAPVIAFTSKKLQSGEVEFAW
jgi:hypothetical protein